MHFARSYHDPQFPSPLTPRDIIHVIRDWALHVPSLSDPQFPSPLTPRDIIHVIRELALHVPSLSDPQFPSPLTPRDIIHEIRDLALHAHSLSDSLHVYNNPTRDSSCFSDCVRTFQDARIALACII